MPLIQLHDPPSQHGEQRHHVPASVRLQRATRIERAGPVGDGAQADHGVAPPRLVGVVGAGCEPIEPVVDDREAQLECLYVGEELQAVDVIDRYAVGAKLRVQACGEG
ncbi:hypothetical protein [Agromyces ramosus]|uniref:hypothetical protein n=1 Tax=Agromyces ramosus TaxID=33879 RepID=UPI00102C8DDD|nr:hypothetical protein [Agromyces ramosus]